MEKRSSIRPKALAAAAILVAAAGAGGCGSAAYARRTAEDARISALVQQQLATAAQLSSETVQARSYCGVVALVGEVPQEQQKRAAGEAAIAVPGVVRVNNLILVVKGDSQAEGSPLPADSLLIARTP
jgi:osmotically-inducible protein OsmY